MSNILKFNNVSATNMDALRRFMKNSEAHGYEVNKGTVATDCFSAEFEYDPKAGVLLLEPTQLMKNLTPELVTLYVNDVIRDSDNEVLDTQSFSWPHKCAVYNWVICDIDNQLEGALTYSTNSTPHGQFKDSRKHGKVPGKETVEAFQNQGSKDSTTGCHGSVTYTLADGETQLVISYGLNTLSAVHVSAGLQHGAASRYQTTVSNDTHFGKACAYVKTTVTLGPYTSS